MELANRVSRGLSIREGILAGDAWAPQVRELCDFAQRPDDALGAAQALLDALEPYRQHHTCPLGADVHEAIERLQETLAENHRNEGDA